MKLSFFGADQCVTGSCHCIEANGKKILVDCGLQQGRDEVSNTEFPFAPGTVDYVLVTHAHIDHTGRIPLLIKQGFQGEILTTRLTGDLMRVMLLDSAHIQEQDAEWKNRKGARAGEAPVEPLYTIEDAQQVSRFLQTCEYGQPTALCEGVTVTFVDAGHLLGSASIIMDITEGDTTKKIVFSGDLGNINQPIIRDPTHIRGADYVVMESTYGDRNHDAVWSYTDDLAAIIDETMARDGNVVIPSFAVGRTQELLYFIREIKDRHMVKSVPDFPVYIDSPLAKEATEIFTGDLHGYLDEDALKLVADGTHMFNFSNLRMRNSKHPRRSAYYRHQADIQLLRLILIAGVAAKILLNTLGEVKTHRFGISHPKPRDFVPLVCQPFITHNLANRLRQILAPDADGSLLLRTRLGKFEALWLIALAHTNSKYPVFGVKLTENVCRIPQIFDHLF